MVDDDRDGELTEAGIRKMKNLLDDVSYNSDHYFEGNNDG